MKNPIPSIEELAQNKALLRDTSIDPKLEYLNEKPFELNAAQIAHIKQIFDLNPKTRSLSNNLNTFNQLIRDISGLIRNYHSIKDRSSPFNDEVNSIMQIQDWLKDLRQSKKALDQINRSEDIALLLQRFSQLDYYIHTQNLPYQTYVPPRSLIEMGVDIDYLITKLEQLSNAMQSSKKTGRPLTDPMRYWFIRELAKLYEAALNTFPTLTQNNPFDQLVGYTLVIIGDPIEDTFNAIKKAFKAK